MKWVSSRDVDDQEPITKRSHFMIECALDIERSNTKVTMGVDKDSKHLSKNKKMKEFQWQQCSHTSAHKSIGKGAKELKGTKIYT